MNKKIYWIRRGQGVRKWDVLAYNGRHIMSHDFLCDAQGVAWCRGGQGVIISERSSKDIIFRFYKATGITLEG